jgi:peptidoglycan/LPS O-acetylase OafA/YrhL
MDSRFSIYLDFIRLSAALIVAISHFAHVRLTGGNFYFFEKLDLGHDAVIVFFVLSGYVIAFVAHKKPSSPSSYLTKRLARLYSVLIPALILGLVLDYIGTSFSPELYQGKIASDFFIGRGLANLFYLQEIQFFSIRYLSNGPIWSLGFEFWYYVLFMAFLYPKSMIKKIVLVLLLSIFIGIKM